MELKIQDREHLNSDFEEHLKLLPHWKDMVLRGWVRPAEDKCKEAQTEFHLGPQGHNISASTSLNSLLPLTNFHGHPGHSALWMGYGSTCIGCCPLLGVSALHYSTGAEGGSDMLSSGTMLIQLLVLSISGLSDSPVIQMVRRDLESEVIRTEHSPKRWA